MYLSNEQFISEYLERIDYRGSLVPCRETLVELQRQHAYHVPFENLDLLGEFTPNLDRDYLFDKVVTRRRGGVCYELNTCFYNLLTAMGFDACQISGAVQPGEDMFSHVATLVHLEDGDYIADVGFGDSYLPVLKTNSTPSAQYNGCDYFLTAIDDPVFDIMRQRPGEEPCRMYTMALTPRKMSDYFDRFRWASAKGNTVFSQYPICVFRTPQRCATLRRGNLTVECEGQITESRPIAPGEETERCLREYFDLP